LAVDLDLLITSDTSLPTLQNGSGTYFGQGVVLTVAHILLVFKRDALGEVVDSIRLEDVSLAVRNIKQYKAAPNRAALYLTLRE